jgi:hypothetical protein
MNDWIERQGWRIVLALAIIDIVTLAITGVIALNQGAAIDKANNAAMEAKHSSHQANHAIKQVKIRVCHNSAALIQTDKRQIEGYNRQLAQVSVESVQAFLPNLTTAQAQAIVDQQRKQFNQGKASAYRAIHDLSKNCSAKLLQL